MLMPTVTESIGNWCQTYCILHAAGPIAESKSTEVEIANSISFDLMVATATNFTYRSYYLAVATLQSIAIDNIVIQLLVRSSHGARKSNTTSPVAEQLK